MQHKSVKARCLFCEVTVGGNQRDMVGVWYSPDDLTPTWLFNREEAGPRCLCYAAGNPDTNQDFYLCPKHNDPHYFHAAMKWADEQLQRGQQVDFTNLQAELPVLALNERWEEPRPFLPNSVPDINEIEMLYKLPNTWQVMDGRLDGCLEISYAITDIFDSASGFILEQLDLINFPKPLELAEAMKKAATNIELLTEAGKLADGEDLNQDS